MRDDITLLNDATSLVDNTQTLSRQSRLISGTQSAGHGRSSRHNPALILPGGDSCLTTADHRRSRLLIPRASARRPSGKNGLYPERKCRGGTAARGGPDPARGRDRQGPHLGQLGGSAAHSTRRRLVLGADGSVQSES